ncbi:unnamed protein product [Miscanthus lutarioriparius]|uniref:C2 domain-containing protein n=1 Tax=Miscanthus lutarioriparius TaxID=422564 RepID=A0A811QES8_9POAL|nr:unnamed protein product [Miscanthus lutarioriparius]
MSVFARVQRGAQRWYTPASPSAKWDEGFFLVAVWPFDEPLEIAVIDIASPERHEMLGEVTFPMGSIKVQQFDKKKFKPPAPSWHDLELPRSSDGGGGGRRHEFRSKIQLRVYYDAAYHVLDEVTSYASDFQPSARRLRSQAIGVLELAVLRATGLRSTKRPNGGRGTVDAYCVAKYGQKWIRTRTLLDTASPSWKEQFTFDVFDPCTVLTVAVFDNSQLSSAEASRRGDTDAPLGKVCIRVSTLASGRTYEQPYSLFVVHPTGLLQCGELHLAVRFTHTVLVLIVFVVLAWMPFLVLPTFFLYLFAVGAWNFWQRPVGPAQMEHYSGGVPQAMLEEEFDAGLPSGTPPDVLLQWYLRLRETAAHIQGFIGDVASKGERVHAVLERRDGRATVIALVAVAALTVVSYAVPFKALVSVTGVYVMRHPLLRRKEPSALMSFFRRLPSNADCIYRVVITHSTT